MSKFLRCFVFTLLLSNVLSAQDFSNKGTDFWVGYGYHQIMNNGNQQRMVLYFATDQVTTITVRIPFNGFTQTITSGAMPGVITSVDIPRSGAQDVRLNAASTSPENKGIHITATKPIVAYAHIFNQSVSGATILFPTNTLGKEYNSINFINATNTSNSNCFFYVVATDTGTTTVEITPTEECIGHPANQTFTVNLTQGQIYNVMGITSANSGVDLTGSSIKSIPSATGVCKRIGVFSGSGRIGIDCNGGGPSSDNYMVQSFPRTAWGKKYLTSPTGGNMTRNIFRICVSDPAALVRVNGAPITVPLLKGFFYDLLPTSVPQKIESDLPITVAQYVTSQNSCGNGGPGDPEVIYLSSVEQNIDKVIWFAAANFNISEHHYNVIIPNTGTALSSFTLDGTNIPLGSWTVHPKDAAYSYLTQNVSGNISHVIQSDSGFNAIAYGFGSFESYGYNAGTNVRDLYQQVGLATQYGIGNSSSVCTGTPFKFKISLPYRPDSLKWDFFNAANAPGPNLANVVQTNPANNLDSTTVVGGKTLYWYSLPNFYTFNNIGQYPVRITAYSPPVVGGCGNSQDIDFNLDVSGPPAVSFSNTVPRCVAETVDFSDLTTSSKPAYKWYWNFDDVPSGINNTASTKNTTHTFTAPGTYNVKFSAITTAGCIGDTISKPLIIAALPSATISGTAGVCLNAANPTITFTGAGGSAPYTFSYNIGGGATQTITTTGTSSTATVSVSTAAVGNTVYNLTGVQNTGSTLCVSPPITNQSATISVQPLPQASISGNAVVCQLEASPLVTFTGSGSVAPYTFTYTINNGAPQTITTAGTSSSVTLPAPTALQGTFIYKLTSVSIGATSGGCSNTLTPVQNVTIQVKPLLTATISGGASVCLNAPNPAVILTGGNGTAPYTITYSINGISQTPVVTAGNTKTIAAPTNMAGTFIYTIDDVKDVSAISCFTANPPPITIVVYAAPVADFTFSNPACNGIGVSFDGSSAAAGAGSISTYTWNFGNAASGANNISSLQNPIHLFTGAGTFNVSLTITTSNGCTSVLTKSVTVNVKPVAAFTLPEVCLLDPFARFTDNSTTGNPSTIAGWLWNFGEPSSGVANTSTLKDGQHKYSAVGNYTVQLIVTTNNGCKDTISKVLTINGGNPVSDFIPTSPAANCSNSLVGIQNKSTIASGNITRLEIAWDNTAQPTVFDFDEDPVFNKIYTHKYADFQSPLSRVYNVRVRAYSGGVCFSDKIIPVTVNASPKVVFNTIPIVCFTAPPFQITQAGSTAGIAGNGVFSGPGVSATGLFNPAAVAIGVPHSIKYVFTSTAGGCMDSATQTIVVADTASAQFTFAAPVCEDFTTSFTDVSTKPAGSTLTNTSWDFGDGTPAESHVPGSTFTHAFPNAGSFVVTMYATTGTGCNSTIRSKTVKVNPIPRPSFTTDKADYCLPDATVIFNSNNSTIADGTANAFTYLWNFGDPASGLSNTSTAKNPTHTYAQTGDFVVNLQIRSVAGCVHDTSISLIGTLHPAPVADFVFSPAAICVGEEVNFIDKSDGKDGAITAWAWNFGDNAGSSTLQTPLPYTYLAPGTYPVKLSIVNSLGCIKDTTRSFTVNPFPTVNAGEDRFVLEGGSITLDPTVTGTGLSYLWSWNVATAGGYLSNPSIKNPVSSPLTDVLYKLTVTALGGCSASDEVFVKLLKSPQIPNTFSPNNDGINDFWTIQYLDSYPNAKVQVFTRTGSLVFQSKGYMTPWNGTLNGKSLPVDTYYYIIEPQNGREAIKGFITILK